MECQFLWDPQSSSVFPAKMNDIKLVHLMLPQRKSSQGGIWSKALWTSKSFINNSLPPLVDQHPSFHKHISGTLASWLWETVLCVRKLYFICSYLKNIKIWLDFKNPVLYSCWKYINRKLKTDILAMYSNFFKSFFSGPKISLWWILFWH